MIIDLLNSGPRNVQSALDLSVLLFRRSIYRRSRWPRFAIRWSSIGLRSHHHNFIHRQLFHIKRSLVLVIDVAYSNIYFLLRVWWLLLRHFGNLRRYAEVGVGRLLHIHSLNVLIKCLAFIFFHSHWRLCGPWGWLFFLVSIHFEIIKELLCTTII